MGKKKSKKSQTPSLASYVTEEIPRPGPGEVVWAKLNGYPFWPAIVMDIQSAQVPHEIQEKAKKESNIIPLIFLETPSKFACATWDSSHKSMVLPFRGPWFDFLATPQKARRSEKFLEAIQMGEQSDKAHREKLEREKQSLKLKKAKVEAVPPPQEPPLPPIMYPKEAPLTSKARVEWQLKIFPTAIDFRDAYQLSEVLIQALDQNDISFMSKILGNLSTSQISEEIILKTKLGIILKTLRAHSNDLIAHQATEIIESKILPLLRDEVQFQPHTPSWKEITTALRESNPPSLWDTVAFSKESPGRKKIDETIRIIRNQFY